MNWKHASFVLAIALGSIGFTGCEKHRHPEAPGCYELNVAWADGTTCADVDVRWLGRGEWRGVWSEGYEEIPLSPFLPIDEHGVQSWCRGVDDLPLHAVEMRLQADSSIAKRVLVADASPVIHAVMPKPIAVRLRPGKLFPASWLGSNTVVWADSLGWASWGVVNWHASGCALRMMADSPELEIWMDLPATTEGEWSLGHWQYDLDSNGPWPDSLDWFISTN